MGMEDATAALAHASLPAIVGTGLLLGVVHVLTGPDHLSALIVLSAGSSWRSCQLGMRWGCGHSTGLIVVTAAFLAVNRHLDIERFGSYCDFMVGFLMMALGLWGLRHYLLLRRKLEAKRQRHALEHGATEQTPLRAEAAADAADRSGSAGSIGIGSDSGGEDDVELRKILHEHGADHDDATAAAGSSCCFGLCAADIKNPRTQQLTAFLYGTAHGLAGTGGILGVLPAVILNDWAKSSAYLGAFCVASILIMGVFAAAYGELTGRMSRFSDASLVRVGVFSSCISLAVGALWVVLVSTGTLDEVFG